MRGDDQQQSGVFSYISAEQRVPQDHPLRPIREMVDEALRGSVAAFQQDVCEAGRPSIAPEKLLRALLLQMLVLGAQRAAADGADWTTTCCSAGSWD